MKINKRKFLLIIPVLAVALTACTEVEPDAIGLRYSTGVFDGKKFVNVVDPGTVESDVNDIVAQLPTSQRSFIVRRHKKADVNDVISVAASDGLLVDFESSSAFELNTRTDDIKEFEGGTARKFYEEICRHYDCGLDDDGTTSEGWKNMLLEKFYPQLESAFKDEARRYDAAAIVNNTDGTLTKLQVAAGKTFLAYLERQTGGQYFCGPTFDRTGKGCPPVEMIIISADYHNPKIRDSREAKKVATDQSDAQGNLQKALQDPNYLEYLRIEAYKDCVKAKNVICSMGNSTPPVAVTPQR